MLLLRRLCPLGLGLSSMWRFGEEGKDEGEREGTRGGSWRAGEDPGMLFLGVGTAVPPLL